MRSQVGRCIKSHQRRVYSDSFVSKSVRSVGVGKLSENDTDNKYAPANQTKIYLELSKATLSSMVVITSAAGYLSYGGGLSPLTCASLCAGTSFAAATAAILNQTIERDTDKLMKRTRNRPLPSGRISTEGALGYGLLSLGASYGLLKYGTNDLTLLLGFSNIALYGAYTIAKPKTEWNTWIGAVVGAIPPVMGWTAAGGDLVALEPLLLGGTLFLWQFPHFFALSWNNRKDYERGFHQMVPVNDPTGDRTAELILKYSLFLLPIPVIASAADITSPFFALGGVGATTYLIKLAENFEKEKSHKNAHEVFKCSLWYLLVMLGLFVFHRKRGEKVDDPLNRLQEQFKMFCPHEFLTYFGLEAICPVKIQQENTLNKKTLIVK